MNNIFSRERDERERRMRPVNKMGFSPMHEMVRMFYFFLGLFAAYVCFKINKGFSWSIILALVFSPIYLVYAYSQHGKKIFKF